MAEFPGGLVKKEKKHVASGGNLRNLALHKVQFYKRREKTRIQQIFRNQFKAAVR